jgi:general secretion pathway protein D
MMTIKNTLVIILLAALAAGCAPKPRNLFLSDIIENMEKAERPGVTVPAGVGDGAEPKARGAEKIEIPDFAKKKEPRPVPVAKPPEPVDTSKVVSQTKPVMINVEGMALPDFITYGIGETLKVNFFMEDAVRTMRNPVTLRMTKEMPSAQALDVALEVLYRNGLTVTERMGTLYIEKAKVTPSSPRPLDVNIGSAVPAGMHQVLQVVPLQYVRATEAMTLINDYYKTGVSVKVWAQDTLLLFGPAASIKEIVQFLDIMDVPYVRDRTVLNIRLTYWQPEEFIRQVTAIMEGLGITVAKTAKDPGILFIPIRFLSSVLFVSHDERVTRLVMSWKDRLDTAESAGTEEKVFMFRPRFSRASDIAESVKRLYGATQGPAGPAGSTGPARTGGVTAASPGALPTAQPQTSAAVIPGLKISADDRRNIIVVMSAPTTYKNLLPLFEELDKPQRQVLIEATFAELTLKDDLKLGLEWYLRNVMGDGSYALGVLFGTSSAAPGLTYAFTSDSGRFRVLMNAFAQNNLINIISAPRVLVLDNQEATIQVGTEVPIVTSEQSVTGTTVDQPTVLRNIQYRQTGVTLRVRPTINTEGVLTLNISQEISEAQTNAYSSIDSPMILSRRMQTQIIGENGKTIILGGLMAQSESSGENKVPFLGDIPILGYLFKTSSRGKTRTELIVMMTPLILTSTDEAVNVTNEMRESLKWLR